MSFKGQQRTSLLKFGSLFTFSEFKDKKGVVQENVFRLTPVDNSSSQDENDFTDVKESMEELDNSRVEDMIDEIIGEDNYEDALPFNVI
jgi:phage gp29-like protein